LPHQSGEPGGPRYDLLQTAAERHGYDNLLLLCGTHHTVIDDDEEAYTVERLMRMKTTHEQNATSIEGRLADNAARLLVNQFVASTNQSGGIAANSVTAGTINLYAAPRLTGGTPDWTIRELFHYLRPTISPDGPISEWDDVGNDILDKLSAGQLQIWGREIVRGAALSFRNLTPIDSSYWRAARFTYAFLLDGHERDLHVSQTESTRLPDLGDLRVNREDALALWPHPLRARWTVESIVLSARYFNAPTQEVSIPCTSLTLFDAQIETHYDGYGNPQYQSVTAPAHIMASGIDAGRLRGQGWEPQLLSFIDLTTSAEQLFVLTGIDAYADVGKVKFIVESPQAITIRRFSPEQLERAGKLLGERINRIPIGMDLPTVLQQGPKLIIHAVPASAFDGRRSDPKVVQLLGHHFRPDGYDAIMDRSRAEGWVWFQPPQPVANAPNPASQWYSRLDLTGFVEIVLALHGTEVSDGQKAIRGYPLERHIVKTLDAVADAYARLNLRLPVLIRITLFGVTGMKLVKTTAGCRAGFERQVVVEELQLSEMTKPLGRALRPLLDSIWRAAGWPDGSPSYVRGDWDGYTNAYPYGG